MLIIYDELLKKKKLAMGSIIRQLNLSFRAGEEGIWINELHVMIFYSH